MQWKQNHSFESPNLLSASSFKSVFAKCKILNFQSNFLWVSFWLDIYPYIPHICIFSPQARSLAEVFSRQKAHKSQQILHSCSTKCTNIHWNSITEMYNFWFLCKHCSNAGDKYEVCNHILGLSCNSCQTNSTSLWPAMCQATLLWKCHWQEFWVAI